jgi:hypothetical protein
MNKKGIKPESLLEDGEQEEERRIDLLDQDSVTRFDNAKKKKKKKKPGNKNGNNTTTHKSPKSPSNKENAAQ